MIRRRQWHPTPLLLPGKSHGQRSLVDYSPWGRKESDTTEQLHFHFHTYFSGGRSGDLVFPSLEEFSTVFLIHTVKGFSIGNKAEVNVFLELSYCFNDPTDVGNLISGSSAFFKYSFNIRKFMVHVVLKPSLDNYKQYVASI